MTQELLDQLKEIDSVDLLDVLSSTMAWLMPSDLKSLETEVTSRAKKLKPYRLKIGYRRCSKQNCYCQSVELHEAHGPYITLTYRDGSKNIRESLGRAQYQDDINKLITLRYPDELDFEVDKDTPNASEHTLTDSQYQRRYGIAIEENHSLTIDRPNRIHYDWEAYSDEFSKVIKMREAARSRWSCYGIASPEAVEKLERVERRGYYLKEGSMTIERLEEYYSDD